MIKHLKHSVTFPSNGISLKGDLSLQPGLTAIIGDNGSGKTFGSIELIRYLLFGKKALRGPAKDYKNLEAEGMITIQGEDYKIYRGAKAEWVKDSSDETLAVGAEAVTQRMCATLGFGLEVFDVVCASVQKESDKLSKMQPTARRRLIDEVLGLASNELVEKACRDEAKALRRDADTLSGNLSPLMQPVQPEGYKPSSAIKLELEALKLEAQQRANLQLSIDRCGEPPVEALKPTADIEALQQHEDDRRARNAEVAYAVAELEKIPVAQWTDDELDSAQAHLDLVAEIARRGAKPTLGITEAEAVVMHHEWDHLRALQEIGSVEVQCPSCDHQFQPGVDLPTEPEFTVVQLKSEMLAMGRWSLPLPPEPALPVLTSQQILEGRVGIRRAEERDLLLATTWLKPLDDKSVKLQHARKAAAVYDVYVTAYRSWAATSMAAEAAREALDEMGDPPAVLLSVLDQSYVEARVYETQVTAYERARESYDTTLAAIAAKTEKSAAFKRGAEALVKARSSVKEYLAPSLSRVSSSLIHEMSGGVLSNMIVDEDMNITVDGQDIATLSGAGSTVANLSLRLALGQVLVRNILPIFIADEADADLSSSRAEFTAECLNGLKEQLAQIVIITHKEVGFADHVITR